MERPMMNRKIPETDSIEELARFWDRHDLTKFDEELEEVPEPVFDRGSVVKVRLRPQEFAAIEKEANHRGVGSENLIREWILERINGS